MNPTKTGGLHECSRMIGSSCSTCGNHLVIFVRKHDRVISLAGGKKDGNLYTTNEIYPWSFVTQIFRNGSLNHDGDRKTFWSGDFFDIMTRKHWFNNSRPLSRKSWYEPEALKYLREIYFIYWLNFNIHRFFKFTVYIIVRFTCFDFIAKAYTQHIGNTICI